MKFALRFGNFFRVSITGNSQQRSAAGTHLLEFVLVILVMKMKFVVVIFSAEWNADIASQDGEKKTEKVQHIISANSRQKPSSNFVTNHMKSTEKLSLFSVLEIVLDFFSIVIKGIKKKKKKKTYFVMLLFIYILFLFCIIKNFLPASSTFPLFKRQNFTSLPPFLLRPLPAVSTTTSTADTAAWASAACSDAGSSSRHSEAEVWSQNTSTSNSICLSLMTNE